MGFSHKVQRAFVTLIRSIAGNAGALARTASQAQEIFSK